MRTSNHISRAAHTGHSPMLLYTHRPIMFTQSRRSIGSQRSRKRCTNTLMHAQRTAVRSKFILSSVLAVSAPHPRSSVSVAGSGQRAAGSGQRAAGSRAAPIPSEGGPLSPEIGGSNGEGRHGDEEGGGEAQAERRREASRTLERWLLRRAWGAAGETDHDLRGDPRSSGELRRADLTHLPRRWHRSVAGQKGGWGGLARGVGGGGVGGAERGERRWLTSKRSCRSFSLSALLPELPRDSSFGAPGPEERGSTAQVTACMKQLRSKPCSGAP